MTEEQIEAARKWCEAAPKGLLDMIIGANSRPMATFYAAALAGWPAALDALEEKDAEVAQLKAEAERLKEKLRDEEANHQETATSLEVARAAIWTSSGASATRHWPGRPMR